MKIDFWKDLKKILIGFLAMFGGYNAYFSISGNLPKGSADNFTVEIAGIAAIVSFLVFLLLVYMVYLKKGGERITSKDFAKMVLGACLIGVAGHVKNQEFVIAGIYLVLFFVSFYCGFLKNAKGQE